MNPYLTLTASDLMPPAGTPFTVTAKLDAPASRALIVVIEKQRIGVSLGGQPMLCGIGEGYFTKDGLPGPITIERGKTEGHITVQVKHDAENFPCPPPKDPKSVPVNFPDFLMLSGFIDAPLPHKVAAAIVLTVVSP